MNTHNKIRKTATTAQGEPHREPTVEQIQLRAYEIYLQRGRTNGFELSDWLQAEKELKTSDQDRSPDSFSQVEPAGGSKRGNRNR